MEVIWSRICHGGCPSENWFFKLISVKTGRWMWVTPLKRQLKAASKFEDSDFGDDWLLEVVTKSDSLKLVVSHLIRLGAGKETYL